MPDPTQTGGEGSPPPSNEPWYSALGDEELRGVAADKGWKSPEEAVRSYHHLMKLQRGNPDVLALPKEGDAEGWGKVYERLGRPETPDAYAFDAPDGFTLDNDQLTALRKTAHEAGLSKAQWEKLSAAYAQSQASVLERTTADMQRQAEEGLKSFKAEFKTDDEYNAAIGNGQRAVRMLGIDDATLDKLDGALGQAAVLKLLTRIGAKLGDDKFVPGAGGLGRKNSREQAQAEMNRLKVDNDFVKSLTDPRHPNNKANVARWQDLQRVAFAPEE